MCMGRLVYRDVCGVELVVVFDGGCVTVLVDGELQGRWCGVYLTGLVEFMGCWVDRWCGESVEDIVVWIGELFDGC